MGEKGVIFNRTIPVDKIIAWANGNGESDEDLRDNFIAILEKNGWNDKCNENSR